MIAKWVTVTCKVNQQRFVCRNAHKSILDVMTQLSTTLSSELPIPFKKGKAKQEGENNLVLGFLKSLPLNDVTSPLFQEFRLLMDGIHSVKD